MPGFPDGEIAWAVCSVAPEKKARLSRVRLRWLSVQLLFELIDQFLIVGLDAKISVPSYWTVFSVFARDLIFQRREQLPMARRNEKVHVVSPRMRMVPDVDN